MIITDDSLKQYDRNSWLDIEWTQLNFNHGRGQMRCRMDSKYTGETI